MPNLLENIDFTVPYDWMSLVKAGANRKGRFPIVKGQEDPRMTDIIKALEAVLKTKGVDEDKLEEIIKALDEKAKAAVTAAFRSLQAYREVLPADFMGKFAELVGFEAPEPVAAADPDPDPKPPEGDDMKCNEEIKKALDALPDEVRKAIEEKMEAPDAKYEEIVKKAELQEAEIKKLRDEADLKKWRERTDADLSHYPEDAAEIAKGLKELADVKPELAEKSFETMKKASAAIKGSALLGAAGRGSADVDPDADGSVDAKITKLAKGLVQKAGVDKLTFHQAYRQVLKENPELYDAYNEEQAAKDRQ